MLEAIADPEKESHMIDSTIVRAHACAVGYGKDSQEAQALGRSKGGFTTTIHALVDGVGYPLKMTLTAGQRHDITQAEPLTCELSDTILIADRGYESTVFVESLAKKACRVVMPPRRNAKLQRAYDRHTYKERHLIECFFGKIKHFRRVFSRFDKTAKVFLGFLHFVSVLIWLR
jgi:transposase